MANKVEAIIGGLSPQTLLNAATGTGASGGIQFVGGIVQNFTCQVTTPSTAGSFSVSLQASLDGSNWFNIGSAITSLGLATVLSQPSAYIRANLTALTGGTNPTLTFIVCGC